MTLEQLERTAEISEALESLCLGSVTHAVIEGAVTALLDNWDDHNETGMTTMTPSALGGKR